MPTIRLDYRRRSFIFAVCIFIIGSCFALYTPPAQVSDEVAHFYRAYQISKGDPLPVRAIDGRAGGYIDDGTVAYGNDLVSQASRSSYSLHKNLSAQYQFSARTSFQSFDNTAVYAPLLYLPSAAAIYTGRTLALPISTTFYLARLANVLVFSLLCYVGFRLVRGQLQYPALIIFFPGSLYVAGSVSQDSQLIALAFVAACALLALYKNQNQKLAFSALCVSLFLLVTSKLPYAPLALLTLLPFLYPQPQGRQLFDRYKKHALICLAAAAIGCIVWFGVIHTITIANIMPSAAAASLVDPDRQLQFIGERPISALLALLRTNVGSQAVHPIIGIFGMFGYKNGTSLYLPWECIAVWCVTVAGLAIWQLRHASRAAVRFTKTIWATIFISIGMSILLVQLALYLHWSAVGLPYVAGLHGRYYVPIVIIAVALLPIILGYKDIPALRIRYALPLALLLLIPGAMTLATYY